MREPLTRQPRQSHIPDRAGPIEDRPGRIHGIDLARGLALFGMTVAHYVWPFDEGLATGVAFAVVDGRAMPLFMFLGGVGVVLVARRRPAGWAADRGLVIRALILMMIGLVLDATVDRIFIVLQFYGLLFALSPLLRRLPTVLLGVSSVAVTAVGAWTFQTVGDPRRRTSFEALADGRDGLWSLLFDGAYPFFPVAGFFLLGLAVGRLDLRSPAVARAMVVVGAGVGIGSMAAAVVVVMSLGLDPVLLVGGSPDPAAVNEGFRWARLLDISGHSAMPAWTVSAAGTSAAVLGLSLWAARRAPGAVAPVATLGTVALSYYVFQAVATLVVPSPMLTSAPREWATVVVLFGGFTVAAMVWKRWFSVGPLEALLRLGSGPRSAGKAPHG